MSQLPERIEAGKYIIVKCPKCGRIDKFVVTDEHIKEIEISGISNIAIDHGDHVILVAFDIWGSIRGTYVYKKAQKGKLSDASLDLRYETKKIVIPEASFGESVVLYIFNREEKNLEVYGRSFPELENKVMKILVLMHRIENTLKVSYDLVKMREEDFTTFIVQSKKFSLILTVRDPLDAETEKKILEWLVQAKGLIS
ncbi:MAG: hypothetical protein ACP6IP_01700 [Candidatus Njordarchaeia archaeon]